LVHASKDQPKFKEALLNLVLKKYAPIIGDLDLKGGTSAQLDKAFRDSGVVQGQMLTKTVRFLVKALIETGFPVSPHITKPKPKTPRTTNGKGATEKPRPRADKEPDRGVVEDRPPAGVARLPIPGMTDAYIQYPLDLTEAQVDLFQAFIGALRTYAQGRSGGKDKK
jgi:hypothetical protein